MSASRTRLPLRALYWAFTSGLLLTAGFAALVGGLIAWAVVQSGATPTDIQQQSWLLITVTILRQMLLPLWGATLASWLVLARIAPGLDGSWRRLVPGILALASLWFGPIGHYLFVAWTPGNAAQVLATLALCAGGVSVAVLLPRRLWSALAPGAFAPRPAAG